MSGRIRDLGMTPFDDLFSSQESRSGQEAVVQLPLAEIDPFEHHPFQVRDDEAMEAMKESIRTVGVLTPVVVRRKEDGRYELVSGHRRRHACKQLGIGLIPAVVREMSRDEAVVYMVDSNLQREKVLPSEKAFSYKMKLEAMKRQGQRTSRPLGTKLRSDEQLATRSEDSARQIQRYIRLTELIPELLQMVDDGKFGFRPAVEISYLTREEQTQLLELMKAEEATPSLAQALRLKQFSQQGELTADKLFEIMTERKPNQKEQLKIPKDRISRYFAPDTSPEVMEATIIRALEFYRKRQRGMER